MARTLRVLGTPVGYCGYELSRDDPAALKVGKHMSSKITGGKGLGRFMLGHVEKRARELGRHTLVLQVNKRNAAAIAFYRRRDSRWCARPCSTSAPGS